MSNKKGNVKNVGINKQIVAKTTKKRLTVTTVEEDSVIVNMLGRSYRVSTENLDKSRKDALVKGIDVNVEYSGDKSKGEVLVFKPLV